MDLNIIISGIIGTISTIICSYLSYLFTRKKYETEVNHNQIENMQKSLDFYKELSDDSTKRLELFQKQMNEILDQNRKLIVENSELKSRIEILESKIDVLIKKRQTRNKTK